MIFPGYFKNEKHKVAQNSFKTLLSDRKGNNKILFIFKLRILVFPRDNNKNRENNPAFNTFKSGKISFHRFHIFRNKRGKRRRKKIIVAYCTLNKTRYLKCVSKKHIFRYRGKSLNRVSVVNARDKTIPDEREKRERKKEMEMRKRKEEKSGVRGKGNTIDRIKEEGARRYRR